MMPEPEHNDHRNAADVETRKTSITGKQRGSLQFFMTGAPILDFLVVGAR